MKKRVGLDVGGVILHRDPHDFAKLRISNGKHKKKILHDKEKKKIVEPSFVLHAQEAITRLAESNLYDLYIVSYCQLSMKERTTKILQRHGFSLLIPEVNWIFVQDRKDKAQVCQTYKLDVMIDDRYDVLENIHKFCTSTTLYWFQNGETTVGTKTKPVNKSILVVKNWRSLATLLLGRE
jgi:hypothetical protein